MGSNVIGINFYPPMVSGEMNISERAFEGMTNLKFLRFNGPYGDQSDRWCLPQSLYYLSRKIRLLEWNLFPMTYLPLNFCTEYLVELQMRDSKVQKLWEGDKVRKCYVFLFKSKYSIFFSLIFVCLYRLLETSSG